MTDTTRTDDAEGLREGIARALVRFKNPHFSAALIRQTEQDAWPLWSYALSAADAILAALTPAKPVEPTAPAISGDDALLPCPFCGDGDAIEQPFMADGLNALRPLGTRYMHCETCGADGPGDDSISDARAAWNARAILADPACRLAPAGDDPVAAERERCAKRLDDAADRLERGKRVPAVDRHTALVLRSHATAIRSGEPAR